MIETVIGLLQSKAAWIVGFALLMVTLERLFPAARPLAAAHLTRLADRLRRLVKNVSLAGLNAVLSPLIVIPVSAAAAQWSFDWRPLWWQGAGGLLLDLLVLDFWIYWWHVANHRVPFLWRFHEVHHLDQFLDATTALRFHAGEVVLSSLVRAGVIFLLAVPLASVVVFEVAVMFAALFHHSNVKIPARLERTLSWVVVTPAIHWVHHHAVRRDTDSNYATILSLWDRLFGNRSPTQRWPEMPIGVERLTDKRFFQLVVRPFRRRRD
jgi:sterol desaturase/sphingolipid hydroxylase (fatty acid hydroxylase superfamily)